MGIYIKDMEMPVFEHQSWDIRRGTDGKWYMVDTNAETSDGAWHEIVPVPLHGRLGDLDVLYSEMETYSDYYGAKEYHDDEMIHRDSILYAIEQAPTVIPAEEGDT